MIADKDNRTWPVHALHDASPFEFAFASASQRDSRVSRSGPCRKLAPLGNPQDQSPMLQ